MKMKKRKDYDIWLHWFICDRCNMDCRYCAVGHIKKIAKIPKIDTISLMKFLNGINKTFHVSFTGGGEPFLVSNLIEACEKITKRHYISLITNLTSFRVKEFAKRINPNKVFCILASAHIKELERRNLLDTYFDNFLLLKKKGFNIMADEVAYPPLTNEVKRYKQLFKEKNIELKFSPFLGKYNGKKYPNSYIKKELKIFKLNKSDGNSPKRHYKYHKICNAGYNVAVVDSKGNIYPCMFIKDKIGNIYYDINLRKNLITCPFKFCGCPLNVFDQYLFNKALKEARTPPKRLGPSFVVFNFFQKQLQKIDKIVGILSRK